MTFEEWEERPIFEPKATRYLEMMYADWKAEREEYMKENTILLQQAHDREMLFAERDKLIGALERSEQLILAAQLSFSTDDTWYKKAEDWLAILAEVKEQG